MTKAAIRFRVDLGREEAIGPGKIALLEQIERGGSLSQAARSICSSSAILPGPTQLLGLKSIRKRILG